ncbi:MAG: hypothetical protein VYD64_01825, partial [Pseudomonadota bacterium]|nr:hypothetical protein [Pseudomonadota bacterium]
MTGAAYGKAAASQDPPKIRERRLFPFWFHARSHQWRCKMISGKHMRGALTAICASLLTLAPAAGLAEMLDVEKDEL